MRKANEPARAIDGDNKAEMARARQHIRELVETVVEELQRGSLLGFGIVMAHNVKDGEQTQVQVMGGSLCDPLNTLRMADAIRDLGERTQAAAMQTIKENL